VGERDKCLVFSTQDLDIVEEIATRVIVMGKEHNIMADGQPEDFLFNPDFLVRPIWCMSILTGINS